MPTKVEDITHEYLEARLRQPIGRRGFLRLSGGIVVTTSIAGVLAACASTASGTGAPTAGVTAAPTPVPTPKDITGSTIDFIGLDGEDAAKVDLAKAWLADHKVTLTSKYIGSGDEVQAAIKAGQAYDIAMSFNPYVQRFAQANIIRPLDISRLTHWADMFGGLSGADFISVDGKPYAAPLVWGDGPYVYNPKKVTDAEKPTSILDLYDAKWKKRLTMANDPGWLFWNTGVALGFPSPNLTKDQLKQVAAKAQPFVKEQVVSFSGNYADATDLLVRGEVDLSLLGWEAMLNFAKDKGGELAYGFFKEGLGGWCDSMSIPTTSQDDDAAYAYIDALLSPEINAATAVSLVSGATNQKAVAFIAPKDNIYNYDNVKTPQKGVFEDTVAPEAPTDPNIASRKDWTDAWAQITA